MPEWVYKAIIGFLVMLLLAVLGYLWMDDRRGRQNDKDEFLNRTTQLTERLQGHSNKLDAHFVKIAEQETQISLLKQSHEATKDTLHRQEALMQAMNNRQEVYSRTMSESLHRIELRIAGTMVTE